MAAAEAAEAAKPPAAARAISDADLVGRDNEDAELARLRAERLDELKGVSAKAPRFGTVAPLARADYTKEVNEADAVSAARGAAAAAGGVHVALALRLAHGMSPSSSHPLLRVRYCRAPGVRRASGLLSFSQRARGTTSAPTCSSSSSSSRASLARSNFCKSSRPSAFQATPMPTCPRFSSIGTTPCSGNAPVRAPLAARASASTPSSGSSRRAGSSKPLYQSARTPPPRRL